MSTATSVYSPNVRASSTSRVPWTIWAGVLASTSASLGGAWDVAWHRSVGRDRFLSAPHLAIYACGVIAAVVCGYLIFATTFGRSEQLRADSVQVLGFRAPLGAFIAAWGGIAMLTSAPFDNWWHNAYGLDVKIISPPHALLMIGIRGVSVGVLFLTLAALNRSHNPSSARVLRGLFLYVCGIILAEQMFFCLELTWDIRLHSVVPYIALGVAVPVALALASRASGARWACTLTALLYTVMRIGEILIFPLVPASPKLGPVYLPVTHLIPAKFPILIVLPAIALDLLFRYARRWKTWQLALAAGVLFTAVLVAFEWPFASFLMSKASETRFFGTIYFDYNSRPDGWDRLREFVDPTRGLALAGGLLVASACAALSTLTGLVFGDWMRGVQR